MNTLNSFNNTSVGLSGTDFSSFTEAIPASLKFTTSKQGLAARRVPIKIRPEQQQYSSNNNRLIRFRLPNATLYDTRAGYMTMNVQLSKTGGTYIRAANGIFSIFNRLRILVGSTEVEDIRDYNRIYAILWEILNPNLVTTNLATTIMGFGTQIQRNVLGAAASTDYAMPIMSGILGTELLPFDNIEGGVWIELYIEDPTTCLETDGTAPIITVNNPMFHCERLELDMGYRTTIKNYVSANGLRIGFDTWERYINPITTGATQNIVIQHRSSSLNEMLNIFVNSQTINDTTVNNKFTNWTQQNIATASVIVNNMVYPDEPVDMSYASAFEAYQIYCRWAMKYKLNGILPIAPVIAHSDFIVDRFIRIDDFMAYPEEPDLINPFSTLNINANIIQKLNFSGSPSANYQQDTWAGYFKQVTILRNGKVEILQ